MRPPSPLSYGQLKLLPFWDPLRGDPRFEEIVASLAPEKVRLDQAERDNGPYLTGKAEPYIRENVQ